MRTTRHHTSSGITYRALPNTQGYIMFNLTDAQLIPEEGVVDTLCAETAFFISAATRHVNYYFDGMIDLFGIQFQHGYLRELLQCDLHEFKGQAVILSELMGSDAEQLQQRLMLEPQNSRRRVIIEQVMTKKCQELKTPNPALLTTYHTLSRNMTGAQRIATLSHNAGISERQFERIYQQHIGMPPKRFAEIQRFWHSSLMLNTGMKPVDIAHALGFADQSHFNRIFLRYAGISPGTYMHEQHVGFIQDNKSVCS